MTKVRSFSRGFMENYICTENDCVEPENLVFFYRAAVALLLNHPETVFYDGGRAFTDDLLNFAESNAGDEIFERIIET